MGPESRAGHLKDEKSPAALRYYKNKENRGPEGHRERYKGDRSGGRGSGRGSSKGRGRGQREGYR